MIPGPDKPTPAKAYLATCPRCGTEHSLPNYEPTRDPAPTCDECGEGLRVIVGRRQAA